MLAARRLGVQHVLRPAHHLLLLLLHGGHVPAGRRGRQPEEAAGVHPEHPPGQADGRLHRLRADAHHASAARSTSPSVCVVPSIISAELPRAVPLGRHVDHDRRRRRARHGQPDRGAPHHAQLRGLSGGGGADLAHPRAEGLGRRMRLVFVGPPGAGKGTQAKVVCARVGHPADLDGRHAARGEGGGQAPGRARRQDGGRRARARRGRHRPHRRADPRRRTATPGFLLDGFPRTVPQAEALDATARAPGPEARRVLALEVPRELLIERAVLRRTDKRTGQIYHLKYNPPPPGRRPRAPGGRSRGGRPKAPRDVRGR